MLFLSGLGLLYPLRMIDDLPLERVDLRGSSKYFPRGTSVPVRSIVTSKLDCSNGSLTYPTVEYSTVGTVRTIISYFPAV
jgi:hypothetical protein